MLDDDPKNNPPPPETQKIQGSNVKGSVKVEDGSFTGRDHFEGLSGEEVKALLETVLLHSQKTTGISSDQSNALQEVKNLLEVMTSRFQESVLRKPEEFDQMLSEFQNDQEELREWKILHNYFDNTIQKFDQFARSVQSANTKQPNMQDLRNAWFPLGLVLDNMLAWAKTIHYIGEPYFDDGTKLGGVAWAGRLELSRREIEKHLNFSPPADAKSTLFGLLRSTSQIDPSWIARLTELASQYHTLVLSYMHEADDRLLACATQLTETSEKFLRR